MSNSFVKSRSGYVTGAAITVLGLLVLLVVWSTENKKIINFAENLRVQSVPTAMLDNGSLGKILKRLGNVQYDDNTYERYREQDKRPTSQDVGYFSYNPFQRKRKIGAYLYTVKPERTIDVSNENALILSAKLDIPFVRLSVTPQSLRNPDNGILIHPENTGRDWERPANISVYSNGKRTFAGNAGIRLRGSDFERKILFDDYRQGFNIYFRAEYGDNQVPGELIFSDSTDIVLRTVELEQFDIVKKALAMEVARLVGVNQPVQQVVVVGLNSELPDLRLAREAVSHRQWTRRTPGQESALYIAGDNQDDPGWELNTHLIPWIPYSHEKRRAEFMNMEFVGKYFDVESMTREIAFSIYCGSSDWHDWAVYLEPNPGSNLKWLLWEFGSCFSDRWNTSAGALYEQDWLGVVATRSRETGQWVPVHNGVRVGLFAELLNFDPDYPEYFRNVMNGIIDNDLDYLNLSAIIARYRKISEAFPDSLVTEDNVDIDQIDEFFKQRPAFIREQLQKSGFQRPTD